MPRNAVGVCRRMERRIWMEKYAWWVVYCAFLLSFTRSAAFGCLHPSYLFSCVACAYASVCLLISSVPTSTSLLNPPSYHPPPDSIATVRPISCHCVCGILCVPFENNNRVGWQIGSVYLEGLNRLITSSDNDRTGWRQTWHARSMCS